MPVSASEAALQLGSPLILSACVWFSPSPSLGFRCCASLLPANSSALPCAITGGGGGGGGVLWGIPRSHHFSSLPSTRAPCLYTHKSACHFYCLLLCSQGDVFSLLVPSPFFPPFPSLLSATVLSICVRPCKESNPPPPSTSTPLPTLSLDRGGRLGCLVMAT